MSSQEDNFKEIEQKVKEISRLDYVNDAYLDNDCLSEGYLAIQIELKEPYDWCSTISESSFRFFGGDFQGKNLHSLP